MNATASATNLGRSFGSEFEQRALSENLRLRIKSALPLYHTICVKAYAGATHAGIDRVAAGLPFVKQKLPGQPNLTGWDPRASQALVTRLGNHHFSLFQGVVK
nr:hypothetical protein [Pandoravirus aubagnensis]